VRKALNVVGARVQVSHTCRYVVTQREFVNYRAVFRSSTGGTCVVFRNGDSLAAPRNDAYVRGETLGVLGFTVEPAASSDAVAGGCNVLISTAADPKGFVPAYLINFVARRTPRIWISKLLAAVAKFRAEVGRLSESQPDRGHGRCLS
jgi:hypothetical protein